jgi:hypothetical protein
MDNTTKWILFVFFLPGLVWDVITTFGGISSIINSGAFAVVLTIFINGILAITFVKLEKSDTMSFLSGVMWLGAISGDLITSFFGNLRVTEIETPSPLQYFLIGLSALFTTGSTIAVSYMVFEEDIFNFSPTPPTKK